jgi:hypothetical protein
MATAVVAGVRLSWPDKAGAPLEVLSASEELGRVWYNPDHSLVQMSSLKVKIQALPFA